MDNIAGKLFPEIDPKTWEIVLVLVFTPYDPEARIKSVIRRPWNIGRYSLSDFKFENMVIREPETPEEKEKRMKTMRERISDEKEKAYEMALIIFHNLFTRDFLEKVIIESNNLKFREESIEERKRRDLLVTLKGLYQYANRNVAQNDFSKEQAS